MKFSFRVDLSQSLTKKTQTNKQNSFNEYSTIIVYKYTSPGTSVAPPLSSGPRSTSEKEHHLSPVIVFRD